MSPAPFTVYTTPLSANGRKVLAAMAHLELRPATVLVNVYAGEGQDPAYTHIHPQGKVPTLVDGDLVLWESNAILQYLDEEYGERRLSTPGAQGRADIARWLFWEASAWQPVITQLLSSHVGHLLLPDRVGPPAAEPAWDDPPFTRTLAFLDTHLIDRRWVVGDRLTIADFALAGMAMYLEPCGFDFDRAPRFAAWAERFGALDAWADTRVDPWTW